MTPWSEFQNIGTSDSVLYWPGISPCSCALLIMVNHCLMAVTVRRMLLRRACGDFQYFACELLGRFSTFVCSYCRRHLSRKCIQLILNLSIKRWRLKDHIDFLKSSGYNDTIRKRRYHRCEILNFHKNRKILLSIGNDVSILQHGNLILQGGQYDESYTTDKRLRL